MGGSQSLEQVGGERVTIEKLERDAFGVVHVSEDVVDRLQYGRDQRTFTADSLGQQSDQTLKDLEDERLMTNRLRQDLQYATRDIQVLKDRIMSLEREDGGKRKDGADKSDYLNKLAGLTARQEELQKALTSKFNETVREVNDRFFNSECDVICAELEAPLMQCYMDNPKQPLRCSKLAQAFKNCVNEKRAELKIKQNLEEQKKAQEQAQPA